MKQSIIRQLEEHFGDDCGDWQYNRHDNCWESDYGDWVKRMPNGELGIYENIPGTSILDFIAIDFTTPHKKLK